MAVIKSGVLRQLFADQFGPAVKEMFGHLSDFTKLKGHEYITGGRPHDDLQTLLRKTRTDRSPRAVGVPEPIQNMIYDPMQRRSWDAHTHPTGSPIFSLQDLTNMRERPINRNHWGVVVAPQPDPDILGHDYLVGATRHNLDNMQKIHDYYRNWPARSKIYERDPNVRDAVRSIAGEDVDPEDVLNGMHLPLLELGNRDVVDYSHQMNDMFNPMYDQADPGDALDELHRWMKSKGHMDYAEGGLTKLSPEDEESFQRDMLFQPSYRAFAHQLRGDHEHVNYDDPQYDYRGAWQSGLEPVPYAHDHGRYHWDSMGETPEGRLKDLKSPGHPTRWMQRFMERYGQDPYEADPAALVDALRTGLAPGGY